MVSESDEAGAIREDRLVLPIPPGTHWSDAKPLILPADPAAKALPGKTKREPKVAIAPKHKPALGAPLWFAPPTPAKTEKPKAAKKPKLKNDPRMSQRRGSCAIGIWSNSMRGWFCPVGSMS